MVSYREIEDRFNTQTDTVCGGYPERGPFDSEEEAWDAKVPSWMKVIEAHQGTHGWWVTYIYLTTTLPEQPPDDFEEYAKIHLSPNGRRALTDDTTV